MDQLSSTDASFVHLETPETPMHVGSLMLLDLPEGYQGDYYEDVKAMLPFSAPSFRRLISCQAICARDDFSPEIAYSFE
jgi:Wax ester synthase/diacylglycerol acyltransferase catalytic domain